MATRITKSQLDDTAEQLTFAMRRMNMISESDYISRYSAYGGHTFHVVHEDTSHSNGFAGLPYACVTAREAFDSGRTVIAAINAAHYAR